MGPIIKTEENAINLIGSSIGIEIGKVRESLEPVFSPIASNTAENLILAQVKNIMLRSGINKEITEANLVNLCFDMFLAGLTTGYDLTLEMILNKNKEGKSDA